MRADIENDMKARRDRQAASECGMTARSTLRVDGGASVNNYLVQTQADISNTRVVRPACVETTALGAAYLAGLATGFWSRGELEACATGETVFEPAMSDGERDLRIKGWNDAVKVLL